MLSRSLTHVIQYAASVQSSKKSTDTAEFRTKESLAYRLLAD